MGGAKMASRRKRVQDFRLLRLCRDARPSRRDGKSQVLYTHLCRCRLAETASVARTCALTILEFWWKARHTRFCHRRGHQTLDAFVVQRTRPEHWRSSRSERTL